MTSSDGRIVLFSGSVGMQGHGRRLFRELSRRVATSLDAGVVAAIPPDESLEEELESHGIEVIRLPSDFARLNAEHFRRLGPLAGVARGVARLRLGYRAGATLLASFERSDPASSPTVVHFLDYEYLSLAYALKALEGRRAVSTVVTVHPSDFAQRSFSAAALYKNVVRVLLRPRLRRVARVVCHGDWIAQRLASQFGESISIEPIYYPSEGSDQRRDRARSRQQTGAPADKRVLLWFGMIRKNKRLDVAFQVLRHLPDDVVLLVAGKPTEVSEAQVHEWAREFRVEDRAILHLRYIPEEEVAAYFSAADALIATHDLEFSSASGPVADARTYRLPVFASGAGQIADYVDRFGVGVTGESDEPSAFASRIEEFWNDESRVRTCLRRIEDAAARHSWDAFAARHAAIYRDVLAGS